MYVHYSQYDPIYLYYAVFDSPYYCIPRIWPHYLDIICVLHTNILYSELWCKTRLPSVQVIPF